MKRPNKLERSGEFEWIATYLAPLASENSFDLKDDAAILEAPGGQQLVVTTDAILQGIHFLNSDPVETVAQKALRVNLSDIIAKGAMPFAYSLALGVPDNWRDKDMENFAAGLAADQKSYGLKLTGGDTYRSPERICISITMFGAVSRDQYKSRMGAMPGDILVVSGTMGNGALGLQVATGDLLVGNADAKALLNFYRLPDPPLLLAPIIAKYASASMDISDGLLGDCRKLCETSKVSVEIEKTLIPLSPPVKNCLEKDARLWRSVLSGGDDYQCLCSIPSKYWSKFQAECSSAGVKITEIGIFVTEETNCISLMENGVPVSQTVESFTHF